MAEIQRLGPDLFPAPAVVRQRLSDNLYEAQMLRRLLRVVEDAADIRNRQRSDDSSGGQPCLPKN